MMLLYRLFGVDLGLMTARGKAIVAIVALAVLFGTIGVGFLAYGAELTLAEHVEPNVAALIVAAVLLAVTLVCAALAAWHVARTRREVRRAMAASAVATFGPPAVSIAARHSQVASLLAVVGLGFWLARRLTRSNRS